MLTKDITATTQFLRQRYIEGEITISQAAEQYCIAGIDKLVDSTFQTTYCRLGLYPQEIITLTRIPYALMVRVDWVSYEWNLNDKLKEAQRMESQCATDEERNPYISRILELERLISWVKTLQYSKVVKHELEEYGADAFMDNLIPPEDYLDSMYGVKEFFFTVVAQFKMYTFHPDDGFAYTESPEPGKTFVSEADARWLLDVLAKCRRICEQNKADMYQVEYDIFMKYIRMARNTKTMLQ